MINMTVLGLTFYAQQTPNDEPNCGRYGLILLILLLILSGLCLGIFYESEPSTHESLISNESKNESKNEPIKAVKFKITANEFNQIQAYIFSKHNDLKLLPSHLPANAITRINQEREYFIKRGKRETDEIMQAYNFKINNLIENKAEIIKQMAEIELEIKNLESKQKMYTDMLTIAKTNKKAIEINLKYIISSLLNDFEITN